MTKLVVHALQAGYPLCGFSTETPSKWPAGHKWVNVWQIHKITCKACRAAAEQMKADDA